MNRWWWYNKLAECRSGPCRVFFLKGLTVHPFHSSQTPVPLLSFRVVRITETRFSFGYLITESSKILKTIRSVICSLFIDIQKPTKSNGLQVRQQCRRWASFIWDMIHLHIAVLLEISNNCCKNGKRALSSLSCAGVQFTWTRCCRLSAAEEHRSVCILPVLQTISRDSEWSLASTPFHSPTQQHEIHFWHTFAQRLTNAILKNSLKHACLIKHTAVSAHVHFLM